MKGETRSCDGIRELLLEADPAELRGFGESRLARHLRGCPRCAGDAERVLEAQRRLADALTEVTASSPMQPARARAPASSVSPSRSRTRRRLVLATAPLAAAAVLILILVQQRNRTELLPLQPVNAPIAAAGDVPVVNVTTAHDVAIMKTADPNITVVWYLKRER